MTQEQQGRSQRTLRFLDQATRVLLGSLNYCVTLPEIARLAVPEIADACLVSLKSGRSSAPRVEACACDDLSLRAAVEALVTAYPLKPGTNPHGLMVEPTATGKSLFFPRFTEADWASRVEDAEHARLLQAAPICSLLVVPVEGHGRTTGALAFINGPSGRTFDEDDLALAEDLGKRMGCAIVGRQLFLEAQDALRTRDEFISLVGHQMRTPLTTLLLALQGIEGKLSRHDADVDIATLVAPVDRAERAARRLARLVHDLLDVVPIIEGRVGLSREECDLCSVVVEVVARFRDEAAQSSTQLTVETPPTMVGSFDRLRIGQVLTVLLSNALKFGREKPVAVTLRRANGQVELVVRDQGLGIAPDVLPHIFERFSRGVSVRNYGGLGLGLYFAQQIVAAHGGAIAVDSQRGACTTFTVRLPLHPADEARPRSRGQPRSPAEPQPPAR